MSVISWRFAIAIFALASVALCLVGRASAQSLEVSPISIELQSGQMTTTLAVTNRGAETTVLQIRPFQWAQSHDTDQLTATDQLLVSPPITNIPSGATQTFRLVLRRSAEGTETSYRLLLDQLPLPAMAGSVQIAFRISIPVFAEPEATAHEKVDWEVDATNRGDVLIGINHGGRHARIVNPALVESNGRRLALEAGQTPYILPGAEQRWLLGKGGSLAPGAKVHLIAISDVGPVNATVHVSEP